MSIFDLTSEEGLKKHEASIEYWWSDNKNCILSKHSKHSSFAFTDLTYQSLCFNDYFDSNSSHLNASVTLYNPIIPKDAIIKSCDSLSITPWIPTSIDLKNSDILDLNNVIYPNAEEVNILGFNTFARNLIFHNMTLKNPKIVTITGYNWVKNLSIIKDDLKSKKEILYINILTSKLRNITDLLDIHVVNKGSTHICISHTPAADQITGMLKNLEDLSDLFNTLDELAENIENLNLIYFKSEIYQPISQYPKYTCIKRNNNQWCIETGCDEPDIYNPHNLSKLLTVDYSCAPIEYTEINNMVNLTNNSFSIQNYKNYTIGTYTCKVNYND